MHENMHLPTNCGFEKKWSIDMELIRTTIEACVVRRQLYQAGDYLLNQGRELSHLVLIKSGSISMSYYALNGKVFQIGTIETDNHIFGELEFFTNLECQVNLIAVDALEAFIIDIEKLRASLLKEPKVALFFAYYIASDYQTSVDVFFSRLVYPIAYNIALELYQSQKGTSVFSGYTKQYLEAERFGTTDRVYRRALQKLEQKGVLERSKDGIKIVSYEQLKNYIDDVVNQS